jgi:UDP-N-acetylmuramate--alanine ligase
MGYTVQGSDAKDNDRTRSLAAQGGGIFIGQRADNLEGAEVVVISSAIKPGNPELDEARRRGLPVVRRAEMLAELMRLKSKRRHRGDARERRRPRPWWRRCSMRGASIPRW